MESANEKPEKRLRIIGDLDINSIDPATLDTENLRLIENIIRANEIFLARELELQNQIAKNQKTQQKIFFFFAVLFFSEIIYSFLIGSGYVEPIDLKALMLVFIFLLMGLAYTQFRK